MGGCLTDEAVADLVDGRLDAQAVRSLTEHIDACPACRRLVAAAAASLETAPGASVPVGGTPRTPLARNARVGRYVVVGCVGAGAMGIVYTARDPELQRNVALKLLRADSTSASAAAGVRKRLLREARAMAKLAHPAVISVYDVGTHGDEVFLAMELVDGCTLTEWMREKPRPWREVLGVFVQAGEGLHASHVAGIVHRDFKPDNVLVGKDGRVRVTDFGLARAAEEEGGGGAARDREPTDDPTVPSSASTTRTGALVGTPAYMALEQLDGGTADARSDVFAFCVALYEGLYRERPFAGTNLDELRRAVEAGAIRPPPHPSRVPAWLRRLVLRGLRASPADRPQSMRAVLDAIGDGLARSRRRALVAASGAVVACLGVAAGVATLRPRATHTESASPGSAHAATSSSAPATGPTALTDLPLPASRSADALQAYRRGLQALRDGDRPAAAVQFEHATELDPDLAAAHLRYAMIVFWKLPAEARQHVAKAVDGRETLSARDRLMLEAAQAWMQSQPADEEKFAQLTAAAQARYPLDAELAVNAGRGRFELGDCDGAAGFFERAIALDPGFAYAYYGKAQAQSYAGDLAGARATLDECMRLRPDATDCQLERGAQDANDGLCDAIEQNGERLRARVPALAETYWLLSLAAAARGQPREAIRERIGQYEARLPEALRGRTELRVGLDVLSGDFDAAREHAVDLERSVAPDAERRLHARAALWWVLAAAESGRPLEAARRAQDFLRRKDAWFAEPRGEDFAILYDPVPRFLLAERRGGLLAQGELEEQRTRWVDGWKARVIPLYLPFVWLHGYAAVADTREDAARALAELPAFGPLPAYTPSTLGDAYVGATLLLAGRTQEALLHLRRAASSCLVLESPFEHTQAHLMLGQALAATGDRDGACAAYRVVLDRWGMAKPRSVTAERAASLARGLGCRESK